MDSVLNRPLFRRRGARDHLNDIAGVKKFQDGGGVFASQSGAIIRPNRQPSVVPMGTIPNPVVETNLEPVRLYEGTMRETEVLYDRGTGQVRAIDGSRLPPELEAIFSEDIKRQMVLGAQGGLAALVSEKDRRAADAASATGQGNVPLGLRLAGKAGELRDQVPGMEGALSEAMGLPDGAPQIRERGLLDVEGPESIVAQMSPDQLDIFNSLDRAAESPVPTVPAADPTKAPRGLATPPGFNAVRPSLPPAGMPAAPVATETMPDPVPAVPGGPVFEQKGRGPGPLVTSPAEVAAGLNDPSPEVRDKTVADFMKEFTDAAPEYKGGDKRLMHAMIGFAIAAGDSPNAMTNIARGLQAGTEMFLKDKASKDEFDRQIQLSAMQYGLEGVAKDRERGREPLTFVALEDTTYKGKPVQAGQAVFIPYGEIEKNGGMVPPGFGDSSMVTALVERQKAVNAAIEKDREEKLLDDTFAESQREEFSEATSKALSAQRGLEYMEQALITIGEGGVTGLKGSANQIAQNLAAAAGLDDVAAQFSNRNEAVASVRKGFQNLIPVAFSGTQTGNSISNFDVQSLAEAFVDSMFQDGVFSMAFVTDDKLMNSLKSAMELLESGRQKSLMDMTAVEQQLLGRNLRSGAPGTSVIDPYRNLVPTQASVGTPSSFGSLYRAEDGVYDVMNLGG